MNTDAIAAKFRRMADRIESAKGEISMLALCLREDSPGLWDVVVSASWLDADTRDAYVYVANWLKRTLSEKDHSELSRIVLLKQDEPTFASFLSQFQGHSGLIDKEFETPGGALIRRAIVIIARKPAPTPKSVPTPTIDVGEAMQVLGSSSAKSAVVFGKTAAAIPAGATSTGIGTDIIHAPSTSVTSVTSATSVTTPAPISLKQP